MFDYTFYNNRVFKNIMAEISQKFKNILRICPALDLGKIKNIHESYPDIFCQIIGLNKL